MLKREITYTFTDDEGKEVEETDVFYFHLSQDEMEEWNARYKEGIAEHVRSMIRKDDKVGVLEFFKKLILDAYGTREEGGRRFDKSAEAKRRFHGHMAYKALYVELATNEDKASEFFNNIFPKSLMEAKDQDKPAIVDVNSVEKTKTT